MHNAQVLSWRALGTEQGAEVITNQGCYTADKLVLAAGAWMPHLVPELKVSQQLLLLLLGLSLPLRLSMPTIDPLECESHS